MQPAPPLQWDKEAGSIPGQCCEDHALIDAARRYFLHPQQKALHELEHLLKAKDLGLLRQSVLILQVANAVLDEERRQLEEIFRQQGKTLICRPGCHGCCHQLVLCQPFETALIDAYLHAHPQAAALFAKNYPAWDKRTSSLRSSYLRWAQQCYGEGHDDGSHRLEDYHVPCPFLDATGLCAIYPARPYGCRTSISLDPACPAPHDGLSGSRNTHFSLYTSHQQTRQHVIALLHQHLPVAPATPLCPMPEALREWQKGA